MTERAGPYELVDLIGRGGVGEVWRARHVDLDRTVALKLLTGADPDSLARFKREARIVARLNHPHIAQLFEVGDDPTRPYIAMQLIDGVPLDRAPVPQRGKIAALRDAARAVHFAHREGILHRDLKPANILVDSQGRGVVLDFGLAREVERTDSTLSRTGDVFGTPAFMAPEQALGDMKAIDVATDVWGLGATLFALLAGRPPFDGRTAFEVVRRVIQEDPPSLGAAADPDLDTIVARAMEKDRARRYPTAAAFADELDRFLAGDPIEARPASVMYRLRKRIRRRPAIWALSTALVVATIAWVTSWFIQERELRLASDAAAARLQRRQDAQPHYFRGLRLLDALEDLVYRPEPVGERRARLIDEIAAAAGAAIAADATYAEAYALRASARFSQAVLDEEIFAAVEADLGEATRLDPGLLPARVTRGRLYMYRFIEEVMLDNLITGDPMGSAERHEAWRSRAEADFEAARALGGENEELRVCEIIVPLVRLRFAEANREARELVPTLDRPREAEILAAASQLFLSLVAESMGMSGQAGRDALDRLVALYPRDRYARLLRAYLRWMSDPRDHAGAHADFAVIAEDEPRDLLARSGCGEMLRLMKRGEEALPIFESLTREWPELWHVWWRLGIVHKDLGRNDAAIEAYTRAAEVAPAGEHYPYLYRGHAHRAAGDAERALADYDRAIEATGGRDATGFNSKGILLDELDRLDEAVEAYGRAIAADPKRHDIHRRRGQSLLRLQKWGDAEAEFAAWIGLRPKEAAGYSLRGEARLRGGNAAGAVEDLEKAVALGDSSTRTKKLLEEARRNP